MAIIHILIVDKNRINTRILKTHLLSLEHDLNITEVLTGEAAIIEMSKGEINLVITNAHLPGISGVDLLAHSNTEFPNQKTILMSSQTGQRVQLQAANAGADALISKPVDKADFLDTVERTLGMVSSILPSDLQLNQQINEATHEANGIKKRTGELKIEVNPYAIFLINDSGEIILREGALPDEKMETTLFNEIIYSAKEGNGNSTLSNQNSPITSLNLHGKRMDIHFAHVGQAFLLLTICNPCGPGRSILNLKATQTAAIDLYEYLSKIGINMRHKHSVSSPISYSENDGRLFDSALTLLFKNNRIKKHDADLFWDNPLQDELFHALDNIESLSYEQAFELGLMPANARID